MQHTTTARPNCSNRHAAMQRTTRLGVVDAAPIYYPTHTQGRLSRCARNTRRALGLRGWDRWKLASEASLDIRTVERLLNEKPVKSRTYRRVASVLGCWPWDLNLPADQFAELLKVQAERREEQALAPTITPAAERAPWWRRVLNRILRVAA